IIIQFVQNVQYVQNARARLLGVPSFVLAYDVKVRELAKTLGLENRTIDINQRRAARRGEGELCTGAEWVENGWGLRPFAG
ncbi:hypothetical protein, partial [Salmonella enterica]